MTAFMAHARRAVGDVETDETTTKRLAPPCSPYASTHAGIRFETGRHSLYRRKKSQPDFAAIKPRVLRPRSA
jgi:hypothetical protein